MALTKILPGALGAGAVDSTAAVATGAIQADDLQAGTVTANKFGAGSVVSGVINTACVIDLNDSIATRWGNSQDLQISHDGTHSRIHNNTGILLIESDGNVEINKGASSENMAKFIIDGAVELYHNNSKKFWTRDGGVQVTGYVVADSYYLGDSEKFYFGNGNDLEIYHDGSNSYIQEDGGAGQLIIRGWAPEIQVGFDTGSGRSTGERALRAVTDAEVALYYDASKKFETYSGGCKVYSDLSVRGAEGGSAVLSLVSDEGDDNADNWRFVASADHSLYLQNWAGGAWENNIVNTGNGAVELYHNNIKTLQTEANGVTVLGPEGGDSILKLYADEGDDNADLWRLVAYPSTSKFILQNHASGGWESNFEALGNGAIKLDYDNSTKFETLSTGARVSDWNFEVKAGSGSEARLSIIGNNASSDSQWFRFTSYNGVSKWQNMYSGGWETNIECNGDGNVELYYDDSKRLETWASGVKTFGTYFETNNVTTYNVSFYQQNNTAYSYDIDVGSEGSNGNSFWLVAGYNHYYNTAYGCHRVGMFSARSTSVDTIFQDQQTSGNAGAWSVSKPNSTTFRVTKSAGSYSGWGHGFVQLTFRKL